MIVVGELINSSRKKVAESIDNRDAEAIAEYALLQAQHGANYIDVNAGTFLKNEKELLVWLVKTVQESTEKPCCLDSPDPKALESALEVHKGNAMINSISMEKERYQKLLPLIAGTDMKIIALCMSDAGMPVTTDDRLKVADQLINGLTQNNVPLENIYVDPLVQPVSTNDLYGIEFLNAVKKIMGTFEGVHTICGLSNISYGLPKRPLMNRTFLTLALANGLDAAIVNPLDKPIMATIRASLALMGKDEFCMAYLDAYREGLLDF